MNLTLSAVRISVYKQTRANTGAALETALWLIKWVSESAFSSHSFTTPHAQTVWDSSSSYKIDSVIVNKNFLNPCFQVIFRY